MNKFIVYCKPFSKLKILENFTLHHTSRFIADCYIIETDMLMDEISKFPFIIKVVEGREGNWC
jgi:hypothetical protein